MRSKLDLHKILDFRKIWEDFQGTKAKQSVFLNEKLALIDQFMDRVFEFGCENPDFIAQFYASV